MTNGLPVVPLGEFLTQRKEFFTIDDFVKYKRARVQSHGQGIVLRDEVNGTEIKTKKQQAARTGEFLVAEIDAKVGGFGIVPPELDGAVVSSHYFLFEIDESKCSKEWLHWFVRYNSLEEQTKAQGSTNYAAIRPSDVLSFEIPLPPLHEQYRIASHIQQLAIQVDKAKGLRVTCTAEVEHFLASSLHHVFMELKYEQMPIGNFSKIVRGRGPEYQIDSGKLAINQKCIRWSGIELVFAKEVSSEWCSSLSEHHFLKEGDIVVNSTGEGTIGRSCIVTADINGLPFDSHVLAVKDLNKNIDPKFIVYFLRSPIGQELINDAKGAKTTKQTELGSDKLGKIKLPVPPLDEQRRIVAYLDGLQAKVNGLRGLQSQSQEELDALLPSVLDRAFKGEL